MTLGVGDGVADGVSTGAGVVAGGGVRRGGMVRFGRSRGIGGRVVSFVSSGAMEGVGKTFRGGVLRITGVSVGTGVDSVSVGLDGVAVGAAASAGTGGVLR